MRGIDRGGHDRHSYSTVDGVRVQMMRLHGAFHSPAEVGECMRGLASPEGPA